MPVRDPRFDAPADATFEEDEPASGVELRYVPDWAEPRRPLPKLAPATEAPTRPELPAALAFFGRVPVLLTPMSQLASLPLDHRAGFLVSLIDGTSSIESLLDACAMPAEEAIAILNGLLEQHIVALR